MSEIIVPKEATKYILFQRTQYMFFRQSRVMQALKKVLPKRISYATESFFSHYNTPMAIESFFRSRKVARLLNDEMKVEYEAMKAYLPKKASTILDIGCGVAAIDVLLFKHYIQESPSMYLLDKTEMPGKVYYSYTAKGCYYNSLSTSKNILEMNGVPARNIFLEEAEDNVLKFDAKFDLVVSLISWGFHYPLSTYLDQVYEKMNVGGVLILDVRKVPTSDPVEELRKKFGEVKIITESAKHARVAATK
jgi:SAM-dependent methyltransferase